MATLKQIKGSAIQFLAEDPVLNVGTWSSGGNMNTGRRQLASAKNGTQSATLAFGGYVTSWVANNESYNGSSWTELNDLNTARYEGTGSGTQTAALAIGGYDGAKRGYTETWNGSSWTEVNDMNTARIDAGAGGTQTSSIVFGGAKDPGNTATNVTETWDGSSWSEVSDLNTSRTFLGGAAAVNTAALAYGGTSPGYHAVTEQWNGSSWTEVSDLNTAKGNGASYGTYTAAVLVGSTIPPGAGTTNVEEYNGTSWSEVNDVSNAVRQNAGAGGTTSGISFGGTPEVTATEEFSFPPVTASVLQEGQMWFNSSSSTLKGYGTAAGIPAATWSSGGTMNTGRHAGGGSGVQTAAILFGGQDPKKAQTETYDGTSFTEVNDMNTARSTLGNAGQGSQTATLAFGGIEPALSAKTESWNGSSWTEVNDLNAARGYVSGFGTQTAAICANGYPPDTANVESWDGTSWTEVNNTPYAYSSAAGSGTQTAGLVFGGYYPPVGYNTASFEFDGTNWTSGGTMNTGRSNLEGAGTQTNTLIFGGQTAPVTGKSEAYDGTSFTEVADLSTVIHSSMPAGTSGSAILSAGGAPGDPTASEEFTASAAVVTVTTS